MEHQTGDGGGAGHQDKFCVLHVKGCHGNEEAGNQGLSQDQQLTASSEESCLVLPDSDAKSAMIEVNTNTDEFVQNIVSDSQILVSPKMLMSFDILDTQLISSVPEAVATEMVITTSTTQQNLKSVALNMATVPNVTKPDAGENCAVLVQDVITSQQMAPVVWDGLVDGRLQSAEESSENEFLGTSQESFVALMPSSACDTVQKEMVLLKQRESSVREITKRERDRLKKRQLRTDANFREREKVQAKERMRNKRSDPEYREQEREKDRIRRRLARQRNVAARDTERLRDRSYKRTQRNFSHANSILTQAEVGDESLCAVELICESNMDPPLSMETAVELDTGASVEI